MLEAHLDPSALDRLPAGSRERTLALDALRVRWHLLYDAIPNVVENLLGEPNETHDRFLAWCLGRGRTLDWRLHLHFADFLTECEAPLDQKACIELLAASASRWFASSRAERGVGLTRQELAPRLVVGLKGESPLDSPRVALAELPGLAVEAGTWWCVDADGAFGEDINWQRA